MTSQASGCPGQSNSSLSISANSKRLSRRDVAFAKCSPLYSPYMHKLFNIKVLLPPGQDLEIQVNSKLRTGVQKASLGL